MSSEMISFVRYSSICHKLPESYKSIRPYTMRNIWIMFISGILFSAWNIASLSTWLLYISNMVYSCWLLRELIFILALSQKQVRELFDVQTWHLVVKNLLDLFIVLLAEYLIMFDELEHRHYFLSRNCLVSQEVQKPLSDSRIVFLFWLPALS